MKQGIEFAPGITLAYTLDDFTAPLRNSETVILLDGIAESGEAWRGWVPHLARQYKVIRLDLRGFGASTPMTVEYDWSIAALANPWRAARIHDPEIHEPPCGYRSSPVKMRSTWGASTAALFLSSSSVAAPPHSLWEYGIAAKFRAG